MAAFLQWLQSQFFGAFEDALRTWLITALITCLAWMKWTGVLPPPGTTDQMTEVYKTGLDIVGIPSQIASLVSGISLAFKSVPRLVKFLIERIEDLLSG